MHILFIYVGLPLGGIETLLVRLSQALSRSGARVSVLLATRKGDAGLLAQLGQGARVAYLDEFLPRGPWSPIQDKPLLRFALPLDGAALRQWLGGTPDVCHAADVGALLLAARLQSAVDIGRVTAGVYHDREYLFDDESHNQFVRTAASLFRSLPPRNVVFFNENSVRLHCERFGQDYTQSTLTPIGVDLQRLGSAALGRPSRRIVSIGRLTPFKTYNTHMIETIARMRTMGLEFQYEIYGTGECEDALRAQIAQSNLQDLVHLKGALAYERMREVLDGALAFVGSGTALIEASAAGIPAIIGIEHAADASTYGFLHELKGLSYHDAGLPYALTTFDACLLALSQASGGEYAELARRAQARAQDFGLERTAADFAQLAVMAQPAFVDRYHLGALMSIMLNASMLVLRWHASRGRARFFDRHSNVTHR